MTDVSDIELNGNFPNLLSLRIENIGLKEFQIRSLVQYLIEYQIIDHMQDINLYQPDLEPVLEELHQILKESGYTGQFKKLSSWAEFKNYCYRVYSGIGFFISTVLSDIRDILVYIIDVLLQRNTE